jgi:hypothetical protein
VKLVDKKFVEEDWCQQRQERVGLGMFIENEFPGRLVLFAGVLSREIEEEVVRGRLLEEVGAVAEGFDLVELRLHEGMHGFDVGLESVLAGRYGAVRVAGERLDGLGEVGVVLGLPGPDELRAVVGLRAGIVWSRVCGVGSVGRDRGRGRSDGWPSWTRADRSRAGGVRRTNSAVAA